MKKIVISFFVVTVLSTIVFGALAYFPIEKRVKDSNFIVIGSLKDVEEKETDEFQISKATLVIENVIYGNFISSNEQKLKISDELQVEWRNSKMFACKFGFFANEKEIWFLNVDKNGKIESLGSNTSSSLDDLKEVEKHLRKKGIDKTEKKIELQNEVQGNVSFDSVANDETVKCLYSVDNKEKEYYPNFALSVFITSILLYFILYRSRFKIR
jgi:hypothetical protein